jgi:hypothetical protein
MEKVDEINMNDNVEPKGDTVAEVEEVVESGTVQSSTEAAQVTTKTWVVIFVRRTVTAIDTRVANLRDTRSFPCSLEQRFGRFPP